VLGRCLEVTLVVDLSQYLMAAVLRSGGYSMKDLLEKDKAELYELRKAGLKRQVGPRTDPLHADHLCIFFSPAPLPPPPSPFLPSIFPCLP
jgi:hypothetical protein